MGSETHSAAQPETENPNPMGGADREAALSHAELRAALGLLLGLKQVSRDPESHLKQAGEGGTELIHTSFPSNGSVLR